MPSVLIENSIVPRCFVEGSVALVDLRIRRDVTKYWIQVEDDLARFQEHISGTVTLL